MPYVDNIERSHPLRLKGIRKGWCRSCESCLHSQYQSSTVEEKMDFKGCDVIVGVTSEPMRCSKFSLDVELIDVKEAKYYEEKGIRWGQDRLL
jgi:hypothetical protein